MLLGVPLENLNNISNSLGFNFRFNLALRLTRKELWSPEIINHQKLSVLVGEY